MKPEIRTGAQPQVQGHAHPTTGTFITVGVVLAVITAVEFGILYLKGMSNLVLAVLALLSVLKFYLVATYFMHLRFDAKLVSGVFVVGVVLATLITIALKFVNLV
ncbi:MAG: cytochrome C oxidase subunit IV family protein [Bacillota bacterium]